jgi:NAD(P)-dependent dehydrogenase (short-subunit alcohol dehydrogenase family)
MEICLRDRVALVTGGAMGIGAGIAASLAEAGADIVICDIDEAGAEATAAAVRGHGREALVLHTDIADSVAVETAIARVAGRFGRLDVLVNNAGIEYFTSIAETTEEQWDRTQDVDLKGIFLMTKAALPLLRRSASATVVNIASVHAQATIPDLGAYAAAKGGVVAFTRSLAQDLGRDGIRAISISPGFIHTPMVEAWLASTPDREQTVARVNGLHPCGRIGTPTDIANFVAFACSDLGTFINGADIVIDGGLTTKLHH